VQPDLRPVMGNGASSSQGGLPAYDKRDIKSSVEEEQHDWQPEQAVASRPETLSLQSTQKSYSGASNAGPNASRKEDETCSGTYSDARARGSSPSTEKDYEDEDLETDLRESRAFDDVIVEEQEVSEQDGVATNAPLSDVRRDQPTSSQEICCEEVQPTEFSPQEVLVETTGLRPEEHAMGTETPVSANVHDQEEPTIQEGEMQFDDIPESDISMDEDWPTLYSATIDCPTSSEPAPFGRISQEPLNEQQRPVRTANRPTRYRDSSFETHFQPVPRRHCRKIQKPNSTGHNNINAEVRQDLGRGDNSKNVASSETKMQDRNNLSAWEPAVIHVSSRVFIQTRPKTC